MTRKPTEKDHEAAIKAAREAMGQILELDEDYFGAQARILKAKALARRAMEGLS